MINAIKKSFSFLQLPAAVLAGFTAAFAGGCASSDSPVQNTSLQPNSELAIIPVENQARPVYNGMDKQNTIDVKPGSWGGRGISLVVEKNSAAVDLDFGSATISSRLRTRKDGKFITVGLLTRSGPGPIRLDALPQPQPVRFEGKVTGKQMTLKITLVESGDVMGNYVLARGTQGRLVRMY